MDTGASANEGLFRVVVLSELLEQLLVLAFDLLLLQL